MTPYYIIYFLVSAGIPICFINDVKYRKMAQILYYLSMLFILSSFTGLRSSGVDQDYKEYTVWFNAISHGTATQMEWLRDPAFAAMSYIVSLAGLSYLVVAVIYAFLGVSATILFVKLVVEPRWSTLLFFLFFCEYYLVAEMVLIRSAVAIPLMAVGLYFVCVRRFSKALILYLLSLLFHFSAIVALPVFLLLIIGVKFRSRVWVYSLIAFGVIAALGMEAEINFLSGLYRISEYVSREGPEGSPLPLFSWYLLAHLLTISVCVLYMWKQLSLHQRVATIFSGLGLCAFQIFHANANLASRLAILFDLFWLLTMVVILEKLKGDKRIVCIATITVAGFVLFIKSFIIIGPYSTIFN
jgi:hypothetical protein